MYCEGPVSFTVGEAVRILLQVQENKIYTEQPIGCFSSMAFLINLSKLDDREGIRADDLGVWIKTGVKLSSVMLRFWVTQFRK